ncbi:MAG: hypothetical protein D6713_08335 [Deltaproteobacteria bacterium]|nr:MAG: hypothetical protein D6713_08335 [Deltaproteobacteria bacterium]
MKWKASIKKFFLFVMIGVLLAPVTGRAQEEYSLSPDELIRVRKVEGDAWYREEKGEGWSEVYENMPILPGMSLLTDADSRVELEVSPFHFVRLGPGTEVVYRKFHKERVHLRLVDGTAFISRLRDSARVTAVIESADGNRVSLQGVGKIRVEAWEEGGLSLFVRRGKAILKSGGKKFLLTAGESAEANRRVKIYRQWAEDEFDRWAEKEDEEIEESWSESGENEDKVARGIYDLERHGEWVEVEGYGVVWRPLVVVRGWRPYTYGRWVFIAPAGWVWVSSEPWGWVTYHFGSWVEVRSIGWVWVPPRRFVRWYPARVRFIVREREVRWVPVRPREKVVIYRKREPHRGFVKIINKRVVYGRPVVVRKGKKVVVKDYVVIKKGKKGKVRVKEIKVRRKGRKGKKIKVRRIEIRRR